MDAKEKTEARIKAEALIDLIQNGEVTGLVLIYQTTDGNVSFSIQNAGIGILAALSQVTHVIRQAIFERKPS